MGSHGKKVDPTHCTKQIISITTSNSLIVDNFTHQTTKEDRGGEKLRNSESKSYCFQGLCNELQVLRALICPKQNCLSEETTQIYTENAVMALIPMHCTNPATVASLHNLGRKANVLPAQPAQQQFKSTFVRSSSLTFQTGKPRQKVPDMLPGSCLSLSLKGKQKKGKKKGYL